eukprot:3117844-Lingulodinium_polyedra.AAC.1
MSPLVAAANSEKQLLELASSGTGASGSMAPANPVNSVKGAQPKSARWLQVADRGCLTLLGLRRTSSNVALI